MNRFPLVYIVILNYNSAEETIRCMESIKKISYPNAKAVIVDNNSNDGSMELLTASACGCELIKSEKNLGYANGNNLGIKHAMNNGAEYVCILNNDVEAEENFLEPIIDYLSNNEEVGIAGPCICNFEDKETIQAMGADINLFSGLAMGKNRGSDYSSQAGRLVEVDYLGGACFVCKREVFEKTGLIPENYFLFYEETEFCLRAKRNGYGLVCVTESRVYHKGSATISRYSGLSYYFLNRNRVIFMRRNANMFQKAVFAIYLPIETVGRILIRKESFKLFRYYLDGLTGDKDSIDFEKVNHFLGE